MARTRSLGGRRALDSVLDVVRAKGRNHVALATRAQHAPHVDDHLDVDVNVRGGVDVRHLTGEVHEQRAVVAFVNRAHDLKQRCDVAPPNVVARRVREDLHPRVTVVVIAANGFANQ